MNNIRVTSLSSHVIIESVAFLHAFNDKGRLSSLMENMPVFVILNDQAALLGAAYRALEKSTGR